MEEMKIENEAVYQAEDVIVSKQDFEIFSIKYTVETEGKPLIIILKCAYGTINRGLCHEKFVKLEDESKIKEIFHVIRNKINEIEGVDNMFIAYGKIKIKPSNKQKMELKITSYFANMEI